MSWITNFLSVLLGLLFVSSAYSADDPLSPWVIGADVSHLPQLEAAGARFYEQNKPDDLLVILKRNGINTIRIKVWNEPGQYAKFPADQSDSVGFNNPDHAVALAKRAAQLGFRIMIDFHYSDWWADPGKQHMPIAWQGKNAAQVSKALYQFTLRVMLKLKAEGVTPEWVQVGNEISNGMLWPLGRTSEWDNLALFLKSGSQAVKTVFPDSKVVLHLDAGGDNERCRRWFTEAVRHDVPFDVIGLSYYPIWHGAMNALADNMSDLSQRFERPVMVVETAYPWTKDEGDAQPNIYKQTGPEPWPMTPQGQTAFLSKLLQTVKQVPQHKGLGIIYWEPDFIPVASAGWKKGAGDEWDNVTLFDFHGNALPALHALKAMATQQ